MMTMPRKHQHMMVQQKSHLNVSLAANIEHNLHYYKKNYQVLVEQLRLNVLNSVLN